MSPRCDCRRHASQKKHSAAAHVAGCADKDRIENKGLHREAVRKAICRCYYSLALWILRTKCPLAFGYPYIHTFTVQELWSAVLRAGHSVNWQVSDLFTN